MTLEIRVLAWDRHKNVVGLNRLMAFQPSPLDNLISNGNSYKQIINKSAQFRLTSKRPHTRKMNNNINMDCVQ